MKSRTTNSGFLFLYYYWKIKNLIVRLNQQNKNHESTMTGLAESVLIETYRKRIPKSKAGKLLIAVREQIASGLRDDVRREKLFVPTAKHHSSINQIRFLDKRIRGFLEREDLKQKKQLNMFEEPKYTTERTVIEFRVRWSSLIIQAEYIGSPSAAKQSIRKDYGVVYIRWLHFHRNGEAAIKGMWCEMKTV
jgi:hypothetical protein